MQKILGHKVYPGAAPGSMRNVWVRVQYSSGVTTGRGYVDGEPLFGSEALAAYVGTNGGARIAKYAFV